MRKWLWSGLAAVVGGALVFAGQTSFEDASSNAASWAKAIGIDRVPAWLQTAEVDRYVSALGLAFVILAGGGFVLFLRSKRRPALKAASTTSRISLTDLAKEAAARGWTLLDPGSQHCFDFLDAIRQLGIDGTVPMFGRLVRTFSELTQNEPLAPIPAEIWRTHHVDLFSVFKLDTRGRQHDYAPKNLGIVVVPLAYSAGATRYADLHLDRQGALAWLISGDATQHRGRRLELQQERDATRRIRFNEAVVQAYEQTQGTLAAAAAERLSNGDVEGWYAAAITKERDVALYGRKPPSRVHVEVPQEHLQSYVFREKANELVDQFDDNQRYVDLEIGAADLERRIAAIKTWH